MPKSKLRALLASALSDPLKSESPDCSIVPVGNSMYLVSTIDFFYPLVTDPFLQGQIACCNVLSDLYSLGVEKCDNMLMTLTVCTGMNDEAQEIVTKAMMQGFIDTASKAGSGVTGGQTIMNPSPIIGGVAMSVVREDQFLRPCRSQAGDLILLTKPLGTQIAVNLFEWLHSKPATLAQLNPRPSDSEILRIYNQACGYMAGLNRNAASLMLKYNAHACTDITGFGIYGHAENLVSIQHESVNFVIKTLPVIKGVINIDQQLPYFKLKIGESAETSGGLFIVIEREKAELFLQDFLNLEGRAAYVVGEVVEGDRKVVMEDCEVLEV